MALADVEVLVPGSPEEAVSAFGDGRDVLVVAGGTIVMPELSAGRLRPRRAMLLGRAGLAFVVRSDGTVTIGAATPVAALEDGDEPLATAARHLADGEVRAQATLGGNLCAPPWPETPTGDLQAPLLVLEARVRSAGADGERTEPLETFLGQSRDRLLLDVSYDDVPRRTGYAASWRPHAVHRTILAVAAAEREGELRVAATGLAPRAVRLRAVEQSRDPADALVGVDPSDDALASGWYRARQLPGLLEQALAAVAEGAA